MEVKKMDESEYGVTPEHMSPNQAQAVMYYHDFDSDIWVNICTPDRRNFQVCLAVNGAAIVIVNKEIKAWVSKETMYECIDSLINRFLKGGIES
jgi:ribosome-associated translation inhibitor RaiA